MVYGQFFKCNFCRDKKIAKTGVGEKKWYIYKRWPRFWGHEKFKIKTFYDVEMRYSVCKDVKRDLYGPTFFFLWISRQTYCEKESANIKLYTLKTTTTVTLIWLQQHRISNSNSDYNNNNNIAPTTITNTKLTTKSSDHNIIKYNNSNWQSLQQEHWQHHRKWLKQQKSNKRESDLRNNNTKKNHKKNHRNQK